MIPLPAGLSGLRPERGIRRARLGVLHPDERNRSYPDRKPAAKRIRMNSSEISLHRKGRFQTVPEVSVQTAFFHLSGRRRAVKPATGKTDRAEGLRGRQLAPVQRMIRAFGCVFPFPTSCRPKGIVPFSQTGKRYRKTSPLPLFPDETGKTGRKMNDGQRNRGRTSSEPVQDFCATGPSALFFEHKCDAQND